MFCVFSGAALAMCACLAYNYPPSQYVSLIYAYIAVLARAIVVPSSGPRTLLLSTLMFIPVVIASVVLGATGDQFMPGWVFAIGGMLLSAVAVVLATVGSDIIYGLRRQVSAAQQLGSYKLERRIGEGGIGAVYLAHHIMLRRPTAVKLLLPDRVGADNLARFEREVQHMSQLTHPNTVAVYDYGRSPDGVFYYAMEYLGGGIDLENLVRRFGPQPNGRVAQILAQVCGALGEAHESNIIHRDIKPANIMLCERGGMPDIVKVVDYGLVKEITQDRQDSQQVILGTPTYVAPEAVTDPASVGPAGDLYALGCVGYFLLTGKRLFEGKTAVDICIQHVTAKPKPPSEIATLYIQPELEAILMKCLQKKPADRFASAHEMAEALRALPEAKDWDLPDAKLWWREFKAREQADLAASSLSTLTITVDLAKRE
jgi:serine/threonine-protein kinase